MTTRELRAIIEADGGTLEVDSGGHGGSVYQAIALAGRHWNSTEGPYLVTPHDAEGRSEMAAAASCGTEPCHADCDCWPEG